ncbi:MAG: DUF3857 domain-containing protein [Chitinophagales bacterium]|nr:DUF3857 domain-containing protein [Chitinophagales bacterium]
MNKKYSLFLSFCLLMFYTGNIKAVTLDRVYEVLSKQEIENNDAIIIFDNEHVEYSFIKGSYTSSFTITTTYHRKIRINSTNALNDFNKLYIPIPSVSKYDISDIEGVTIHANKTTSSLNTDDVKETTLPANVPFYRKLKGKVKLFVFPGVNIGDEIEYTYTISYSTDVSANYFNDLKVNYFESEFPVKSSKITVTIPYKLNFNSFSLNTSATFQEPKTILKNQPKEYTFQLNNLSPFESEDFALESEQTPGVVYQVNGSETETLSASWEDELDGFFKNIRRSTQINSELTVGELSKKMKSRSNFKEQLKVICDEINKVYFTKPEEYIKSAYETAFDAQDYSIYQKLAKSLDYDVNFWFVKNKKSGKLNKSFPNLEQFDDVIIEFINPVSKESGYLPLYKPLDPLNYVNYNYNNTDALRVHYLDGNTKYAFETFKTKNVYPENKITQSSNILILTDSGYTVKVNAARITAGEFVNKYKINAYNYKTEKEKNSLYEELKNSIIESDANTILESIELKPYNPETDQSITWVKNYRITDNIAPVKKFPVTLNSLLHMGSDIYSNCETRKSNAYLGFSHKYDYTYTISTDKGDIILNDNFNKTITNDIGTFSSTIQKKSSNSIEIRLIFDTKTDNCKKEQWCAYSDLNNAFETAFQLPLIIVR